MSFEPDYYQTLGIARNATQEEIKEAYRFKAHTVHPDKVPESLKSRAEEEFKRINEAYQILKDPQKRAQYNLDLDKGNESTAGKNQGTKSPPIKPKPYLDPSIISFDKVDALELKKASFIIRNMGGPYDKLWFSNPNSWVRITNWASVNDYDQLPLRVEIEAEGKDWSKSYLENIKVKLDEEETALRVELRTRPNPTPKQPIYTPKENKKFKNKFNKKAVIPLVFIIIWFVAGLGGNNKAPELFSLISNPLSPEDSGSMINWNATASDPENDPLYYRFFLDERPVTSWSTNNAWDWNTTGLSSGDYKIEVRIRDGKHASEEKWDDLKIEHFVINTLMNQNNKPVINRLTSDMPSPQRAGNEIEWKAYATDPNSDQICYRFWLKGPSTDNNRQIVRDWSTSKTWLWRTTKNDVGHYQVAVDVRDGNHANNNDPDAEMVIDYELSDPWQLDLDLNANKPSPQSSGSIVIWKATISRFSDHSAHTIYYRFMQNGPSTNNIWKVVQDWSLNEIWSWKTSSADIGYNEIRVQAKYNYPEDSEEYDSKETVSYIIIGQNQIQEKSTQSITNPPADNQVMKDSSSFSGSVQKPETKTSQETAHISTKTVPSVQQHDGTSPGFEASRSYNAIRQPVRLGGDEKHKKIIYIGKDMESNSFYQIP